MRLVVARCEVHYTGRLTAVLPEAVRLLVFKADGSVLVHDDAGGYKPLNWMTPPTVLDEHGDSIVVRKRAGKSEDRLEIRVTELLSDVTHDMGESAALQKDGVERHLQEELAARPAVLGRDLQLVVGLVAGRPDGRWSRSDSTFRSNTRRRGMRHPLRRGRPPGLSVGFIQLSSALA